MRSIWSLGHDQMQPSRGSRYQSRKPFEKRCAARKSPTESSWAMSCAESRQGGGVAIEARHLAEHVPERQAQQIAGLREHAARAGAAPFDAGGGDLGRERHLGRRRGHAQLGEQGGESRRGAFVEDGEADVDAVNPAIERDVDRVRMAAEPVGGFEERDLGVRRQAARRREPGDARADHGDPLHRGGAFGPVAPAGGGAPGCEEECRRAPPGERGREEGGGEPPGDFSRQGRPALRRKPVRHALARPSRGFPGRQRRCFGTSNLSDAVRAAEFRWPSKSAASSPHQRLPASVGPLRPGRSSVSVR